MRGQADAVGSDPHGAEDAPDLVAAEHGGKLLLLPGPGDAEHGPLAPERLLVEELDAAEGDGVGAPRHLLLGGEVDQVVADLVPRTPRSACLALRGRSRS